MAYTMRHGVVELYNKVGPEGVRKEATCLSDGRVELTIWDVNDEVGTSLIWTVEELADILDAYTASRQLG